MQCKTRRMAGGERYADKGAAGRPMNGQRHQVATSAQAHLVVRLRLLDLPNKNFNSNVLTMRPHFSPITQICRSYGGACAVKSWSQGAAIAAYLLRV